MQDIQDALNLLDAGRPTEAIPMVQELAQQRPAYAAAYVLLARLHESAGHWEEARAAWEQARFLMPNSPAVAEGLQRVRRALEDEPEGQPPIVAQPAAPESDRYIAEAESERVRDLIDTANEDAVPATAYDPADTDKSDPYRIDPDRAIALQTLDAAERLQADAEAEMERAGSGLAEEAVSEAAWEEEAHPEPVSDAPVAPTEAEEVGQDDAAPVEEAADTMATPVPDHEDTYTDETYLQEAYTDAPHQEETPIVEEPEPLGRDADMFADAPTQQRDEDTYPTGHVLDETAETVEPVEAETDYMDLVEAAEDDLPDTYAEEDLGPVYDSKGRLIEEDLFLEIEQLIDEKLAEEGIVLPARDAGPEAAEQEADDAPDDPEAMAAPSAEAPMPWPPAVPSWAHPAMEDDDDLDSLIDRLESARIVPGPDLDALPPPDLDDEIEDMVSETLARIYASQGQYHEAARVYEQLAIQHPDRSLEFLQSAADMRSRAADG